MSLLSSFLENWGKGGNGLHGLVKFTVQVLESGNFWMSGSCSGNSLLLLPDVVNIGTGLGTLSDNWHTLCNHHHDLLRISQLWIGFVLPQRVAIVTLNGSILDDWSEGHDRLHG